MKRIYLLLILNAFISLQIKGQVHKISGYVFDQKTNAALPGANIIIKPGKKGTTTDSTGSFTFEASDSIVIIKVSYVGYRHVSQPVVVKKNVHLNIGLVPGEELSELVVQNNPINEPELQINRMVMSIEKIKSLPMTMGEPDILKALQLLPGVQSGTEGMAGIYVRGGGPDQNLILFDNIPVYNSNHLFGFFSSFNPMIIKQVNLIKGGFPARYGERLSSVIELQSREGNYNHFNAEGSIGLISTDIAVTGPIKKDKISFMAGFRRSYLDLFTVPITKMTTKNRSVFGYYLQDLNTRLNWKLNGEHNVYLSLYTSDDNFYVKDRTSYRSDPVSEQKNTNKYGLNWGNFIISTGINSNWSKRFQTLIILAYNTYHYQSYDSNIRVLVTNGSKDITQMYKSSIQSGIRDYNFKTDAIYQVNENQKFRFGADLIFHRYIPELFLYRSNYEDNYSFGSDSIKASEENFYIEDEINLTDKFLFNVGLRSSNFQVNGKNYSSFQPRISADVVFPGNWHVNASYSAMNQYIHLLINGQLGVSVEYWVPVTEKIPPQQSSQVTVGILKDVNRDYSFSIEGYYKKMHHLIEYTEDVRLYYENLSWEDKVETGDGKAYGVEFFAQKKTGIFAGWVAYTLSRSLRQFDNLNSGKTFPYTYDRIHDISVTGNYQVNEKIEISANWLFSTGIAFTAPLYIYPAYPTNNNQSTIPEPWHWQDNSLIGYSDRNAERYPDFHRLDLGIQFKKQKKWGERAWVISVINAYNRKNPFYLQVQDTGINNQKKLVMHSYFQMVPSLSYRFRFK